MKEEKTNQEKKDEEPLYQSIVETTKLWENKKSMKNVFKPCIPSGFDGLDKLLGGGFYPGWAVLGAISNLGKSTLALQIARNISASRPVLFFSLEMPKEWIAAKLISQQVYQLYKDDPEKLIMARELVNKSAVEEIQKNNKPQWEAVVDAVKQTKALKDLYIFDAKDKPKDDTTPQVKYWAEQIKLCVETFIKNNKGKQKPFVIIDYLQIIPMRDESRSPSDQASIDHNINVLSRIDKDISILLISSLNRNSYKDKNPITLVSFKGSGTIEYSADVVLALDFSKIYEDNQNYDLNTEKANDPRELRLMALKQRYNASGAESYVNLHYYPKYDTFIEVDKDASGKKKNLKKTSTGNKQKNINSSNSTDSKTGSSNNQTDYFSGYDTEEQIMGRYNMLMSKHKDDEKTKEIIENQKDNKMEMIKTN